MKTRYHLRNATHMIEFPPTPAGLAEARRFRSLNPAFKRRRIRHVCQALPSRVPIGTVIEMMDLSAQADMLRNDIGTEREWCGIGIEDEDGFAEVVALAHPSNTRLLAASYSAFDKAGRTLGIDAATLAESVDLAALIQAAQVAFETLNALDSDDEPSPLSVSLTLDRLRHALATVSPRG